MEGEWDNICERRVKLNDREVVILISHALEPGDRRDHFDSPSKLNIAVNGVPTMISQIHLDFGELAKAIAPVIDAMSSRNEKVITNEPS